MELMRQLAVQADRAVIVVTHDARIFDFADRIALARRHLDMLCAYHGETRALRIGRKYVAWTIRGCAGAARLRAEVQTMDTRERLDALLDRALAAGPRPEGWFRPVFVSGEG